MTLAQVPKKKKKKRLNISTLLFLHSLLLDFMRDEDAPLWKGYFYATLMFLLSCLQSLFNHQYMYTCFTVGMRVKTAVMGLVYRKVGKSVSVAV